MGPDHAPTHADSAHPGGSNSGPVGEQGAPEAQGGEPSGSGGPADDFGEGSRGDEGDLEGQETQQRQQWTVQNGGKSVAEKQSLDRQALNLLGTWCATARDALNPTDTHSITNVYDLLQLVVHGDTLSETHFCPGDSGSAPGSLEALLSLSDLCGELDVVDAAVQLSQYVSAIHFAANVQRSVFPSFFP